MDPAKLKIGMPYRLKNNDNTLEITPLGYQILPTKWKPIAVGAKPQIPPKTSMDILKKIWGMADAIGVEMSGEITPDGTPHETIFIGDSHSVISVALGESRHFHTHPAEATTDDKKPSLTDQMSPPSGVDCDNLHRHGRAEYVVTHRGVWGVAPGQDTPDADDENAIFVYIQLVKTVFTNQTPPFDSDETHVLARYWCELMTEFQPDALLPMFLNSAECRDYINDQLDRVWNRPDLSLRTLEKRAESLSGKRYFDVDFWPWT